MFVCLFFSWCQVSNAAISCSQSIEEHNRTSLLLRFWNLTTVGSQSPLIGEHGEEMLHQRAGVGHNTRGRVL